MTTVLPGNARANSSTAVSPGPKSQARTWPTAQGLAGPPARIASPVPARLGQGSRRRESPAPPVRGPKRWARFPGAGAEGWPQPSGSRARYSPLTAKGAHSSRSSRSAFSLTEFPSETVVIQDKDIDTFAGQGVNEIAPVHPSQLGRPFLRHQAPPVPVDRRRPVSTRGRIRSASGAGLTMRNQELQGSMPSCVFSTRLSVGEYYQRRCTPNWSNRVSWLTSMSPSICAWSISIRSNRSRCASGSSPGRRACWKLSAVVETLDPQGTRQSFRPHTRHR